MPRAAHPGVIGEMPRGTQARCRIDHKCPTGARERADTTPHGTGATLGVAAWDTRDTAAGIRVPRPHFVRIEQVQVSLQFAAAQPLQVALEVPVYVVRMVLVLGERTIDEHLRHADSPELVHQDLEVRDQPRPPPRVPVGAITGLRWPQNEAGRPKLVKSHLEVSRRE